MHARGMSRRFPYPRLVAVPPGSLQHTASRRPRRRSDQGRAAGGRSHARFRTARFGRRLGLLQARQCWQAGASARPQERTGSRSLFGVGRTGGRTAGVFPSRYAGSARPGGGNTAGGQPQPHPLRALRLWPERPAFPTAGPRHQLHGLGRRSGNLRPAPQARHRAPADVRLCRCRERGPGDHRGASAP